MRYVIVLRHAEGTDTWEETLDNPKVGSDADATEKGRALVDWFNGSLRPGERARAFVSARVIGESIEHHWEKTSLVTQTSRAIGTYDQMKCTRCGITGKRLGLSESIRRDSRYRAAKYITCEWKTKHA